jgi:hypothetical protein
VSVGGGPQPALTRPLMDSALVSVEVRDCASCRNHTDHFENELGDIPLKGSSQPFFCGDLAAVGARPKFRRSDNRRPGNALVPHDNPYSALDSRGLQA